jgi:hypothetical protein
MTQQITWYEKNSEETINIMEKSMNKTKTSGVTDRARTK